MSSCIFSQFSFKLSRFWKKKNEKKKNHNSFNFDPVSCKSVRIHNWQFDTKYNPVTFLAEEKNINEKVRLIIIPDGIAVPWHDNNVETLMLFIIEIYMHVHKRYALCTSVRERSSF